MAQCTFCVSPSLVANAASGHFICAVAELPIGGNKACLALQVPACGKNTTISFRLFSSCPPLEMTHRIKRIN